MKRFLRDQRFGLVLLALVFVAAFRLGGLGAAVLAGLALTGTPLFAIMGGASELAWLLHDQTRMQHLRFIAPEVLGPKFAGSPLLTTIPLFTLTGYLMAEAKTPQRLIRVASAWVGWLPGGLAIVCVLASAVLMGRHQRVREAVLLRTLGAHRRQLQQIMLAEYAALGLLAALTGAVLAVGANALLAKFLFKVSTVPSGPLLLGGIASVVGLTIVTGWLANRGVTNQPPLEILRQET